MEFGERNLPFRHRVLVVLMTLLALCGLAATHATAADITSRVTVTKTPTAGTYDEWADIRIDIGWSVTTAAPGDTFIVPLDKYLDARRFVPMDLKDAAGAVVARVTIMKDASGAFLRFPSGDAKLQFTFTSYAGTHTNLSGHAWFQIRFDHSKLTFPDDVTTLDTLRTHHPAWRLLRSDHAPLVASFLHRVFVAPNVRGMAAADLAQNSGSFDVIHDVVCHGLRSSASKIRHTCDGEIATPRSFIVSATSSHVHRVLASGGSVVTR